MFNSAEEAKRALDYAAGQEQGRWIATMNTIVLSIFQQVDKMKALLGQHHQALLQFREELKTVSGALQGGVEPQVEPQPIVAGPPPGAPRVGADGEPVTNQAQLEAEALMDAAAGPHPAAQPQSAAPPRARRRPAPGVPGALARPPAVAPVPSGPLPPRMGGDGKLITDPDQLAAEAAMDAALGGG